jgi:hypothetical protein
LGIQMFLSATGPARLPVGDIVVGLLALLLGSGDHGAHKQYGLDRGQAHDVDRIIDVGLYMLDQVEQRPAEVGPLWRGVRRAGGELRAERLSCRSTIW